MDKDDSSFELSEGFYAESIRNTFREMTEITESKRPDLERKAIYIVQLALLSDFTYRKIMSIIEG